jgi:hypothetical protein
MAQPWPVNSGGLGTWEIPKSVLVSKLWGHRLVMFPLMGSEALPGLSS